MHCELVVPGLLARDAGVRLPALELVLARARPSGAEALPLERWLLEAFELADEPLAAGALTLLAGGEDAGRERWARADPVHFHLLRDRIVLVPSAAFGISREEAAALCDALNRHFAGRLELRAVEPDRWCVRFAEAVELPEESALDAAGRSMEPGRAVDALANEAQMLLHDHPVNEAREARGELPINSLWFWGAGSAPREARAHWQSVAAAEPLALGLARAAGIRGRPLPASAEAWLDRPEEDGRHLVVLDALRAPLALSDAAGFARRLEDLEARWFAPLLAALRAGRIGMLTVHAPDAGESRSFEAIRGDLRRIWRRPRPLGRWVRQPTGRRTIAP